MARDLLSVGGGPVRPTMSSRHGWHTKGISTMDADLRLDGNTTTAEGDIFKTTANDLMIDAPARRSRPGGLRRALVHDFNDGLTLNWDSDYPGGVTIKGFRLTCNQADVVLDYAPRRKNSTPWRRALVHDYDDGLTINWANDYPGGVTINGPVKINGAVTVNGTLKVNSPFGHLTLEDTLTRYTAQIKALEDRLKKLER